MNCQDTKVERNSIVHHVEEDLLMSLLQPDLNEANWNFGIRFHESESTQSAPSMYQLPLVQHAGVIAGQADQSISMSLLRLASLAAQHRWHVVYFDPQGSEHQAMQFASLMRASEVPKIYQYEGNSTLTAQASARHTGGDPLRHHRRSFPSSSPDLLRWYLEATSEKAQGILPQATFPPLGTVEATHQRASATYVGINVWRQPEKAVSHAHALLHSILHYVSTPCPERPRLLLLIKHPHLLFSHDQLATLFTCLSQSNDSVFLAFRSTNDLGWRASSIIEQANTLIIHRSHASSEVTNCLASSWDDRERLKQQILTLPDNDCYVLSQGIATHVQLMPPPLVCADKLAWRRSLFAKFVTPPVRHSALLPRRSLLDTLDLLDPSAPSESSNDENENVLTTLFGPPSHTDEMQPPVAPQHPVSSKETKPSRLYVSVVRLLTSDMVHFLRAFLFPKRDTNS